VVAMHAFSRGLFSPAVIQIGSLTARLKARPFKTTKKSAIFPASCSAVPFPTHRVGKAPPKPAKRTNGETYGTCTKSLNASYSGPIFSKPQNIALSQIG
jgi:hypothetical protein